MTGPSMTPVPSRPSAPLLLLLVLLSRSLCPPPPPPPNPDETELDEDEVDNVRRRTSLSSVDVAVFGGWMVDHKEIKVIQANAAAIK